jgi:hypothetical protein
MRRKGDVLVTDRLETAERLALVELVHERVCLRLTRMGLPPRRCTHLAEARELKEELARWM